MKRITLLNKVFTPTKRKLFNKREINKKSTCFSEVGLCQPLLQAPSTYFEMFETIITCYSSFTGMETVFDMISEPVLLKPVKAALFAFQEVQKRYDVTVITTVIKQNFGV